MEPTPPNDPRVRSLWSSQAWGAFRAVGFSQTYPPAVSLFEQGSPVEAIGVVEEGLVKLLRWEHRGEAVTVGIRFSGGTFGTAAAMLRAPHPVTAETLTRCRILSIPVDHFLQLVVTKVRIPEPDFDARREILRVLLGARPHVRRLNTARLAHDLEGFSAARMQSLVNEAALLALEAGAPIAKRHLRAAYRAQTTASRYRGARLGWDDLVLPAATKQKLQSIEKFIENPHLARRLGVAPPSGILLFGPPGTGKTTIARVLASETDASFLAVSAAEIFSKWLGESERQVKELFARARERLPAIVFIDEIDAVAERRGEALSGADHARNAVVNTFLAEMDGLDTSTRIFVIGATNRAELLDDALVRPGRLGETIEIPLPDRTDRLALLILFSKKMRLDPSVDLDRLAGRTEGASGADLRGLCTLAGRNAFLRALDAADAAPAVISDDFERAVDELRSRQSWTGKKRPIGFGRESN